MRIDPNGQLRVEVRTTPQRTQVVQLMRGNDAENDAVLYVWSNVGDLAMIRDATALLRFSIKLSYGAVAIKDDKVVVKHSLRLANADEETLRKAVFFVGRAADTLEAEAYGAADRF